MKEMKNVHVLDNEYAEIKELVRQVRDKKNMGYALWGKVFHLGNTEAQIMAHETQLIGHEGSAGKDPVLIYLLRAGEPLAQGINCIYQSDARGFIAAKRNEESLEAEISYVAVPDIDNADIILADAMLATGGSNLTALQILEGYGTPKTITVVAAIASEYGIQQILEEYGNDVQIFTGTMSSEVIPDGIGPGLNNLGYILNPGGEPRDLGDDMFGLKKDFKSSSQD